MLSGGHSYTLWWTFSILLGIFSVFLSDIMFDVLGENVGHGVQNVGHVRMSDDFSYSLFSTVQDILVLLILVIVFLKNSSILFLASY